MLCSEGVGSFIVNEKLKGDDAYEGIELKRERKKQTKQKNQTKKKNMIRLKAGKGKNYEIFKRQRCKRYGGARNVRLSQIRRFWLKYIVPRRKPEPLWLNRSDASYREIQQFCGFTVIVVCSAEERLRLPFYWGPRNRSKQDICVPQMSSPIVRAVGDLKGTNPLTSGRIMK